MLKMERINGCVQLLNEWVQQQPHLPKNIPDVFLTKCLIASNYSVELSKSLIDLYFTAHSRTPDIFAKRQLSDPDIQDSNEIFDMLELPKLVDNKKIKLIRLLTDNVDKFNCSTSIKIYAIFDDLQLFTDDRLYDGEICIVDLKKSTAKHLTKLSLPLLKKIIDYVQDARPTILKQVHFVNISPFVEKLLLLLKPIVKAEFMEMTNVHSTLETLYKFIPKEVLPIEYGGTDGTIEEKRKDRDVILQKYRFIFDNENCWKVDESKRPTDNHYGDKFGIQGSFRSIDID